MSAAPGDGDRMSDHRDALARTLGEWMANHQVKNPWYAADVAIDALRAEGWSIVKLRSRGGDPR